MAKPFAQILAARCVLFKRHLNDGFSRPARKKVNQIDGIAWGLHPHEVTADLHIPEPGLMLDDFESLENLPFCFLDSCTRGCPQPNANNRRIRVRENLG